jgi:acetylornithine deacetylase/succinyl-diaminopimelate desuccinylase-like protein
MNNPYVNRLLDLAIQIQQVPAPTLEEKKRAEYVHSLFLSEGLQDVSIDAVNNVFGRLAGRGKKRPLIVSAHLDTVFPKNTSLHFTREEDRIYGPGIGDNSLGVAALFGLLWLLRERKINLQGDIWFAANVCEEGLGDLRGMKAVVERFGSNIQAYLVLEGTAFGHVYHRAIGVRRFRIIVQTAGGHSWSDYGQPSAVHELAQIVTQITALPLPTDPRTTLNVGLINGGTGVNVLASGAALELDLRSEAPEALNDLVQRVQEKINSANREGVTVEMEVTGQRPAGEIGVDHPFVRLADECLSKQGVRAVFTSGSTDANIPLSLGYPALVLGITSGGGTHTVHEYIDNAPVEKGMEQLVSFVSRVWDAR